MLAYIIFIIAVAIAFDFSNGMNDAANSIATVVATRVLTPRLAVLWAAFFNFIAAFFFETHVASTIGKGIVVPEVIDANLILAGLLSAVAWTVICTQRGLPISVSHSLIGGLAGAAISKAGFDALQYKTFLIIGVFIVLSPLIGAAFAALLHIITVWICKDRTPRGVDGVFRVLQLVSAAIYSLSHGLNDAQKTMGIIYALLLSQPGLRRWAFHAEPAPGAEGHLAWWIILSCHAAIALGTYAGGWKVIQTLGHRVTKLRPMGGFCAETGGGSTIIALSAFGIPVSTTHTITGAIFGVGVMHRLTAVRWAVGYDIAVAWVLTLPAAGGVAFLTYKLIAAIFHLVAN